MAIDSTIPLLEATIRKIARERDALAQALESHCCDDEFCHCHAAMNAWYRQHDPARIDGSTATNEGGSASE